MTKFLHFCLLAFSALFATSSFDEIDYTLTKNHLMNGLQTMIENDCFFRDIEQSFDITTKSETELSDVRDWIFAHFQIAEPNDGCLSGKDINELYEEGILHGTHDIALVFASMIRTLGYPAIIVETTSIAWSKEYCHQKVVSTPRSKAFVEVYVKGTWILYDPETGIHRADHETACPFIKWENMAEDEKEGYYVLAKGKDIWDCGIYSQEDLYELQKEYAYLIVAKESCHCPFSDSRP
jgi:hypothetical protein